MIEEFEDDLKRKRLENIGSFINSHTLEPEQIIGCTDNSGHIQFLIKWKGIDKADLINAKDAKIQYPQIVQEFYDERLNWNRNSF